MRVSVVGAGVVGLSTAVRLAAAGLPVTVTAAALTPHTTSDVAAAIWYPYLAEPVDRVTAWGETTYAELERLAADEPAAGVAVRRGRELSRRPLADPPWRATVAGYAALPAGDLPEPYLAGRTYAVPVVDTARYLPWLLARARAAGVDIRQGRLPSLDAVPGDLVVNCSGLGARELAHDPSVRPVQGQVVIVEQIGLSEWLLDDDDPIGPVYVVPRTHDVVLGGSAVPDRWDLVPDPALAERVVRRCSRLVPALASTRVLAHRVGLRPARPRVRLSADRLADGRPVVHCYGHGGAGVTLSWGCADEVASLVLAAAR